MDHQRNMRHFIIRVHNIFPCKAMLSQHMPVIRCKNDQRIFIHPVIFQGLQQSPKPVVRHAQRSEVALFQMLHRVRRLRHLRIAGPAEFSALIIILIHSVILFRAIERLMRIKAFHHKKEIIRSPVLFHPLTGRTEGSR